MDKSSIWRRLRALYFFLTMTYAGESAEIRLRMLATIAARPAALILGLGSTVIVAVTVIVLTDRMWPVPWIIADLATVLFRLGLLRRVNWNPEQLREKDHACLIVAGLSWAILFGVAIAFCAATGEPTLLVLAALNVAGVVSVVSSRNAATFRLALLVMVVCSVPWAWVMGSAPYAGMFMIPFLLPIWIGGMYGVVMQNNRILVRTYRAEHSARHMAMTDGLTGLANRIVLHERLQAWCDQHPLTQDAPSFSLLCLDLDAFKQVNDLYGHAFGDRLLKALANRLQQTIRDGDLACRSGGDEFVILLPATDREAAARIAQCMIAAMMQPFQFEQGHTIQIGVSIGGATRTDNARTPSVLLAKADRNLYSAKAAGRGMYRDN